MSRQGVLCGEVKERPPKNSELGEFNGYAISQPISPNTDLLMEELSNFEGKRVLIVIAEVLADGGEIPKDVIQEAVKDAKSCLDWYNNELIEGGGFQWFKIGERLLPKKDAK